MDEKKLEKTEKSVLAVVDNGKPLTNSDMLNELSRAEKILNVIGNGVEKINYYVDTVQEIFIASYNVLRNAVLSGEKISVPALEPANSEIDVTIEFLKKKGYEFRGTEPTEFMTVYIFDKMGKDDDGVEFIKNELEIFADRNGDIHI